MFIVKFLIPFGMAVILVFILAQKPLQNSKGVAVSGNVKSGMGKIYSRLKSPAFTMTSCAGGRHNMPPPRT